MEEVKFRAWRNGKMNYDIAPIDNHRYIVFGTKEKNATDLHINRGKIMQYTGLKDKNGVEIYEEDILKCHHGTFGNVFFYDGSYRLSSDQIEFNLDDIHSYDDLNQYLIEDNNLIVVGNIYENPELLGDKA